ncbi:MAG TPA: hypothetical protein VJ998_04805, partial [Pseudomonadales bacterium]|nr:hypothetical protein [Pseudomonadales bacterium]
MTPELSTHMGRFRSMSTWAAGLCLLLAGCATPGPTGPSPGPPLTTGSATAGPLGNKSPYEVLGMSYHVLPSSLGYLEIGVASWYGRKFQGRLTS